LTPRYDIPKLILLNAILKLSIVTRFPTVVDTAKLNRRPRCATSSKPNNIEPFSKRKPSKALLAVNNTVEDFPSLRKMKPCGRKGIHSSLERCAAS
jgi:hypothetical protein